MGLIELPESDEWAASAFIADYGPPRDDEDSLKFTFIGHDLVLDENANFPALDDDPIEMPAPCNERLIFGMLEETPCEMRVWPATHSIPTGLVKADYRRRWGHWTAGQLDAMSRARQLAFWLHQNRFCGVCGAAMQTRTDEAARECVSCNYKAYPRISPVCIGLVLRGEEMLLGRSPHFAPGIYSALAGFVEPGESAEQCLRREIMEEAGVEINNIRWFGSQSWPYPHSLMMGFLADYAGGELCPQADEIEDLRWFRKDSLPTLPHRSSIAYQMIQHALKT